MARSRTSAGAGVAGALLIALAFGFSARGEPAPRQDAPAPPPFSLECQSGGETIVAEPPLPNVAAALMNRKRVRILTIGASAAAGRRQTPGGYTALIEQMLERAVKGLNVIMINRGVSGELAANAATRIRIETAVTRPDLVLWQVGTNDALAYVSVPHIESTVLDTIHWLRDHKVDVILVGLQRVQGLAQNPHYIAVRDALRAIAMRENVIIVRRDEAMRLIKEAKREGGLPLPDEFEETETGYTCLAQYVARAIALGVFGKSLRRDDREE
jgi:lysophospholipase L1-like esterase